MSKYAINLRDPLVQEFMILNHISKEELIVKDIKDFIDIKSPGSIINLRFNYYQKNLNSIIKSFEAYLKTKLESQALASPISLDTNLNISHTRMESLINSPGLIIKSNETQSARKANSLSSSVPRMVSKNMQYQSRKKLIPLTSRIQHKKAINFELKKINQIKKLKNLETEREERMKLLETNLKSESKKKQNRKNTIKIIEKATKVKNKLKEDEEKHEGYIRREFSRHADIEMRVKMNVDKRLRSNSEKANSLIKDFIAKKKEMEEKEEIIKGSNLLKRIERINSVRKSMEIKIQSEKNMKKKSIEERLNNAKNRFFEVETKLLQKMEGCSSSRLKETHSDRGNHQKTLEKKELQRLEANTRIIRNQMKFVKFI